MAGTVLSGARCDPNHSYVEPVGMAQVVLRGRRAQTSDDIGMWNYPCFRATRFLGLVEAGRAVQERSRPHCDGACAIESTAICARVRAYKYVCTSINSCARYETRDPPKGNHGI